MDQGIVDHFSTRSDSEGYAYAGWVVKNEVDFRNVLTAEAVQGSTVLDSDTLAIVGRAPTADYLLMPVIIVPQLGVSLADQAFTSKADENGYYYRAFKKLGSGSSSTLIPSNGVTNPNYSLRAAVTPEGYPKTQLSDSSTASLKYFNLDSKGYARVFWSHGSNATESIQAALIETVDGTTVARTPPESNNLTLQDPSDVISVKAFLQDGSSSAVAQDGIIMYNTQYIRVSVNNKTGGLFGLRVMQNSFGTIAPLLTSGEGWVRSELEGAYVYGLPVALGQTQVTIPLINENDGGHIKISVYFYLLNNLPDGTVEKQRVEVDSFEFDVINFKLQAIYFANGVVLNKDANSLVPKPEWSVIDGRTAEPRGRTAEL